MGRREILSLDLCIFNAGGVKSFTLKKVLDLKAAGVGVPKALKEHTHGNV